MTTERMSTLPSPRPSQPDSLLRLARGLGLLATLLSGAIFGFFYAWVCSTMWGLDTADPHVAIAAMQSMNASVRNAVFFPAFFLTPAALGLAGVLARAAGRSVSAIYFVAAAVVYLAGGLLLTIVVNVPMNEALSAVVVPESVSGAAELWTAYSGPWQRWNLVRTFASAFSLLLALLALMRLGDAHRDVDRIA